MSTVLEMLLHGEAAEFARLVGLDPTSTQTLADRASASLATPISSRDGIPREDQFRLVVLAARQYLSAEAALQVLQRSDLHDLFRRWAVVTYLLNNVSYLTVDELAAVLEEFAEHLTVNRRSLVALGVPMTSLGCSLPGIGLNYLYPTRAIQQEQVQLNPSHHDPPSPRDRALSHLAPEDRATGFHTSFWLYSGAEDGILQLDATSPFLKLDLSDPLAVADLEFLPGLDHDSARLIENSRSHFLELEINVLRTLADSLRARDAKTLWDRCLRLLIEALTADQVRFYLEMDQWFYGYDIGLGKGEGDGYLSVFPGGLSNLLMLIGHCEKELRVGALDCTMRLIPSVRVDGAPFRSYFQAVGQPWHEDLDRALDQYIERLAHEVPFWDAYQARVKAAIERELRVTVPFTVCVPGKFATTIESQIRSLIEYFVNTLDCTGTLPLIQPTLQFKSPDAQPNDRCGAFSRERPAARRPPGLTNVSAEDFAEQLPSIYSDVHQRFRRRPTYLQLADAFGVSETSFKRYRKRYMDADGLWPPV